MKEWQQLLAELCWIYLFAAIASRSGSLKWQQRQLRIVKNGH